MGVWARNPYLATKPAARQQTTGLDEQALGRLAQKTAEETTARLMPMLEKLAMPKQPAEGSSPVSEEKLAQLEEENARLRERVTALEDKLVRIEAYLESLGNQPPASEPAEPSQEEQAEPVKAKQDRPPVSDEKAEKWARGNVGKWLDEVCKAEKANGNTWRQLAANEAEQIPIKGKPQCSRAYLHVLEKDKTASPWSRMKAKVALEIVKPSVAKQPTFNHYTHAVEVGI